MATTHILDPVAREVLAGDLVVGKFKFCLELKKGYNFVNIIDLFFSEDERGGKGSKKQIRDFIVEAESSAVGTGKRPMIIWEMDKKPCLCGLPEDYVKEVDRYFDKGYSFFRFEGYVFFRFEQFLKIPKEDVFLD